MHLFPVASNPSLVPHPTVNARSLCPDTPNPTFAPWWSTSGEFAVLPGRRSGSQGTRLGRQLFGPALEHGRGGAGRIELPRDHPVEQILDLRVIAHGRLELAAHAERG